MKNIPNLLSTLRILLVPLFVALMLEEETFWAGLVLVLSGLSDMLDGMLARHFGWITPLGKILDPIADKLTQAAVCVVLAILHPQYIAFFVIMIVKELLMMCCSAWLLKQGERPVAAKWYGKVATAVFYCTMILLVFFPALPAALIYTLLSVTTGLVVFAFIKYLMLYLTPKGKIKKDGEIHP
ncbi:MAG: CDP-alcohol phosphatidyltransferase family protein [Oscillospiraceae bacterium]|nr:CDP-alcohol phosphatidyltransferase family protein [Oscillospiraceae bacterium]